MTGYRLVWIKQFYEDLSLEKDQYKNNSSAILLRLATSHYTIPSN